MLDAKTLMQIVNSQLDVGKATLSKDSITMGVVVDGDDPLQSGRLRVFCPNLNDDPKKLHHIPWAVCASPFAGTVSNGEFTRGAGKGSEKTSGAVSYGFWGVPEQGAIVLVTCVDGDERRRAWLGCVQTHQEMHTLFHGRYDWKDGGPDGPLSSDKSPINPQYENAQKAFEGDTESPEWKSRQAEYQAAANPESEGAIAEGLESYLDQEYPDISKEEKDEWVKEILGAHGYDWSSNKALGAFLQSKVYGFSTPGFHAFSMDDRAYNNRVKIRSSTGHQMLFDDTNERIYIATNEGKNWIEFDSNGNIDIYSDKRISVNAKDDINFSTDKTFRVKAKEGIYMYSGDTEEQESLDDDKPEVGEIRFHSTADTHLFSEKNFRTLVKEDWLSEIGGKNCLSIAETMNIQVEEGIDMIVNDGDYQLAVNGNYNHHAAIDTSIFSGNDNKIQAVNDSEVFSYTGKMDIGSQLEMSVKSYEQSITVEAKKENVKLKSNEASNQLDLNSNGISLFSLQDISERSATNLTTSVSTSYDVNGDDIPTYSGSPIGDAGCITVDGLTVRMGNDSLFDFSGGNVRFEWDGLQTSVDTIQDSLDQIEKRVNDMLWSQLLNFLNLKALAITDDFQNYIGIGLPTSVPDPTSFFPSLDLPDFNFDFCIDMTNLIDVERFNPSPHDAFLNIRADLGNWTIQSIKQWANRQEGNFDRMVNNINIADQISSSFDTAINQIKSNIQGVIDSLDNLVNISITSNAGEITNYSASVSGLLGGVENFNTEASNEGSVEVLNDLENAINDQKRTVESLSEIANENPSEISSHDFSDLQDSSDFFSGILNDLSGVPS